MNTIQDEAAQDMRDFKGQFTTAKAAWDYLKAGCASMTFRSKRTKARFTYRIAQKKEEVKPASPITFVSLLTGSDNESSFRYIGHFWADDTAPTFTKGRKSKISWDAPGVKAFEWVFNQLRAGQLPDTLEVWHEGRCGCCGRPLTVPESISTGFGPKCLKRRSGVGVNRFPPSWNGDTPAERAPAEAAMQRMEAEADRAQTEREELTKRRARVAMEDAIVARRVRKPVNKRQIEIDI